MMQQQKNRALIIFFLLALSFLALWINLYFIQIKNHSFFAQLGAQQYTISIKKFPPRALIYDRKGRPLALNKESIAAFITPHNLQNPEALNRFLKKHFPLAYDQLAERKDMHFMYIKRRLSDEEIHLIKEAQLKDIHFLQEPQRFYPNPATATTVGLTNIDNKGIVGLELQFDTKLAGTPSRVVLEKDARSGNYYFSKLIEDSGQQGTPLTLTIDQELCFIAREELKATIEQWNSEEAQAIIMDPTTGEILAMAQYPDFNPNNTYELDLEHTKNKLITEVYELGSVMKIFFALAALESHAVQADELIDCENKKQGYLNGIKLSTWRADGILPFRDVVSFSNNFGTSKVAQRMGTELYEHYKRCGFGKKTGIAFPAEQAGFINPPERWTKQSLHSLSFGYEISATRLQLAQAFCMIANFGRPITPKLILENTLNESPQEPLYSTETMTTIHEILRKVITDGTAHQAAIKGFDVIGKTGTANLLDEYGKYDTQHNIFTFAGIISKNDYRRVIVTFVKGSSKKNVYSSAVAVPPFKRIAQRMIIYEGIV